MNLLETYIDVYKRYVTELLNKDQSDLSMSFYKDDLDYYWSKLSPDERITAVNIVQKWNATASTTAA